jgi:hypothetical protein
VAVAAVLTGMLGGRAATVRSTAGGWLVRSPTGASVDCAGLGEVIAALGPWLGKPDRALPLTGPSTSPLVEPPPGSHRALRLRVDPSAGPSTGSGADGGLRVVVDEAGALRVLEELARPPVRHYLSAIEGVEASWAGAPERVRVHDPARGVELLVWLEHGRRAGLWNSAPVRATCPLDGGRAELEVEIRAGYPVRARAVPLPLPRTDPGGAPRPAPAPHDHSERCTVPAAN